MECKLALCRLLAPQEESVERRRVRRMVHVEPLAGDEVEECLSELYAAPENLEFALYA